VAAENDREFGSGGIKMERAQIVEKVEVAIFDKQDFSFREMAARAAIVHVSTNGSDRGDFAQGIKDDRIADVAEMEDAFNAGESG
jgi:hypothetical protein